MSDEKIRNRGPKKRDPTCLKLEHAILIPAGTILRQQPGKAGTFVCPVAYGEFTISQEAAEGHTDTYRKVIAA